MTVDQLPYRVIDQVGPHHAERVRGVCICAGGVFGFFYGNPNGVIAPTTHTGTGGGFGLPLKGVTTTFLFLQTYSLE